MGDLAEKYVSIEKYNDLVAEREAIGRIQLNTFLTAGARVLDGGNYAEPKCPFCLRDYDLERLRMEVEGRLVAISETAEKLRTCTAAIKELLDRTGALQSTCRSLSERHGKLNEQKTFCDAVVKTAELLKNLQSTLSTARDHHQPLPISEKTEAALADLGVLAEEAKTAVSHQVVSLEFTEYETRIIALIERFANLHRTFYNYITSAAIVARYEKQITTLNTIFDNFVIVQKAALQEVLDRISEDVGRFYAALHPDENVAKVCIKIVGEEGVEFEYCFLGHPTYPPSKYLSESHLNSLGCFVFSICEAFQSRGQIHFLTILLRVSTLITGEGFFDSSKRSFQIGRCHYSHMRAFGLT